MPIRSLAAVRAAPVSTGQDSIPEDAAPIASNSHTESPLRWSARSAAGYRQRPAAGRKAEIRGVPEAADGVLWFLMADETSQPQLDIATHRLQATERFKTGGRAAAAAILHTWMVALNALPAEGLDDICENDRQAALSIMGGAYATATTETMRATMREDDAGNTSLPPLVELPVETSVEQKEVPDVAVDTTHPSAPAEETGAGAVPHAPSRPSRQKATRPPRKTAVQKAAAGAPVVRIMDLPRSDARGVGGDVAVEDWTDEAILPRVKAGGWPVLITETGCRLAMGILVAALPDDAALRATFIASRKAILTMSASGADAVWRQEIAAAQRILTSVAEQNVITAFCASVKEMCAGGHLAIIEAYFLGMSLYPVAPPHPRPVWPKINAVLCRADAGATLADAVLGAWIRAVSPRTLPEERRRAWNEVATLATLAAGKQPGN